MQDQSCPCDFLECSPVPSVLIGFGQDGQGPLLAVSCEARTLFGFDADALAGLVAADLVNERSLVVWVESLRQLVAGGPGPSSMVPIEPRLRGAEANGHKALANAHLRVVPSGDVLAQFTDPYDGAAADAILAEQKQFRSALLELGELAHKTEDDEVFYQHLLERAVRVVPGAEAGSVLLAIPGTTEFRFVAAVGYDLEGLQRHVLDKSQFFRDTMNPAAEKVEDLRNEGRSDEINEWLETVGRLSEIKSNVSVPVLVDGQALAFLSLDNFAALDALNETSIEMMTVLARVIGDLLVRRGLEADLRREREAFRHLALHDLVTGLPNRRQIEQKLERRVESAGLLGRPLAAAFIDLDDFKKVNDSFGHDFGDRVLVATAKALTDAVRSGDIVGRWGGDEFVILPGNVESEDQADDLGRRILDRFEAPLDLGDGRVHPVRLTIGISWSVDSQTAPERLLRRADEALYEAKAAGKGGWHVSEI